MRYNAGKSPSRRGDNWFLMEIPDTRSKALPQTLSDTEMGRNARHSYLATGKITFLNCGAITSALPRATRPQLNNY